MVVSRRQSVGQRMAAVILAVSCLGSVGVATQAVAANLPRPTRRSSQGRGSGEQRSGLGRCPWLDSSLPVSTRVGMLLAAMTPQNEEDMLRLDWGDNARNPYEGHTPAIASLCIPEITEQDGSGGVGSGWKSVPDGTFRGATQLPAPIADAAAFDPSLARVYGTVVGHEDAGVGIDVALAPTINIERDPLWGRAYESLGEDPYLSGTLGIALVEGIQSQHVVAVLKHFAAYNQETNRGRLSDDVRVSERALHEIYLPAFSATVQKAHPGGIMCSYALINGTPSCQDRPLLQGILRHEWHFTGFVRSDCGSVFNQQAAVLAGVSQVKCGVVYDPAELTGAVADGAVTRADLRTLVTPVLTTLLEHNLIARPNPERPKAQVSSSADRAVALRTDDEGAVLLKNDGLLPLLLTPKTKVAIIGADGGTPMPAGFGAMHVADAHPVTAVDGLALRVRRPYLNYQPGDDLDRAVAAARAADVAVVAVHDVEAEGHDRTTLALPGDQDALVTAVARANPDTVVILETGAPVLMPWLHQVKAVLETWYPGQQAGNSLLDLLTGVANPSGKLPMTWPASENARPDTSPATFGGVGGVDYRDGIDVGYRWYEVHHVTPAFPFGYGLSYTHFAFSDLRLADRPDGGIRVSAVVRNTGPVSGADVVQCYVDEPASAGEPPRQLRSFDRVDLDAGMSATVSMTISPGDLAHWSTRPGEWVMSAGTYRIYVGDSSAVADLPLTGIVTRAAQALGVNSGPAPT
jgi:beta-glucosidase